MKIDFLISKIKFNIKNKISSSGDEAKIGSSGYWAKIGSSGNAARIGSSGYAAQIEMLKDNSISVSAGHNSRVKGKIGCWFALSEWQEKDNCLTPLCVKAFFIDGKKVKEDVWYTLKNGKLTKCE